MRIGPVKTGIFDLEREDRHVSGAISDFEIGGGLAAESVSDASARRGSGDEDVRGIIAAGG